MECLGVFYCHQVPAMINSSSVPGPSDRSYIECSDQVDSLPVPVAFSHGAESNGDQVPLGFHHRMMLDSHRVYGVFNDTLC